MRYANHAHLKKEYNPPKPRGRPRRIPQPLPINIYKILTEKRKKLIFLFIILYHNYPILNFLCFKSKYINLYILTKV